MIAHQSGHITGTYYDSGTPTSDDQVSFLPERWIPRVPKFYVWWTGTLGQAEWLITHSESLRGKAVARKCPSNLVGVPASIRPLLSLEQPDLLISDADGKPLMSIEITEQQEFGLNGQQRMARFWSAVASQVPSAYLLPVESYQIEKATASDRRIFEERDQAKRVFLLNAAVLRDINGKSLWSEGIRTYADLFEAIEEGVLPVDPTELQQIRRFVADHISRSGEVRKLPVIPAEEYLHEVDGTLYKAYLRSPRVTASMLLEWMSIASRVTPTYPFKLQSRLDQIFRTNGAHHTMEDKRYPHLSFRNLLPAPGTTEVVHKACRRDELELFIQMVNSTVLNEPIPDLGRSWFTRPDVYFSNEIRAEWRSVASSPNDLLDSGSADLQCTNRTLGAALDAISTSTPSDVDATVRRVLREFSHFHVYKIKCNVRRSLADPYSGVLAVRDILFCRSTTGSGLRNLTKFERTEGLVFYVELRDEGARENSFLLRALTRTYQSRIKSGRSESPMQQLLELAESSRAEEIPKEIRSHLILSDLIVVHRIGSRSSVTEILPGIPHLVRSKTLSTSAKMIRSLTT
jgi:hypothetical protein